MFYAVGQEFHMNMLKNACEKDEISHAYIIEGPDGVGKSIMAKYIAALLLCEGNIKDKPCGRCVPCEKIAKGLHPDVKEFGNNKKSIGINEIRSLIDETELKPYEGSRKVLILKGAQNMTVQAQNAILKTLEEANKGCVIIMLASSTTNILSTILSRCQIIRMGRIQIDKVEGFLESQGVDKQSAQRAAELSDGIIGKALEFLKEDYVELRKDTVELCRKIVDAKPYDVFDIYDFFGKHKDDYDKVFDVMVAFYRDIIVLKSTKDVKYIINKDCYEILVEQSQKLSYNKLNDIVKIIMDTREKLRQNVNYQLSVEVMLLNIQEV